MNISEHAIIVKTAKFQENSLILNCFSRDHGMLKGLLKSRKTFQFATPGTLIHLNLKARLESHLGTLQIENIRNYISLICFDRLKLRLINCLMMLCMTLLHERDTHPAIYDNLLAFLDMICEKSDLTEILKSYAVLELEIMTKVGYGLDLSKCIASNHTDNLAYISPKSGCAVSKTAGEPYHDKLFKMPEFYLNIEIPGNYESISEALRLNEHFLNKRIFEINNMNMPEERRGLANILTLAKAA
jgi:DNA repair protein RecO (recombination protein O)